MTRTNFALPTFTPNQNILGPNHIKSRLEEKVINPSYFQGYDANRAMRYLLEWKGFRRLYIYAMTENMKAGLNIS